MNTTFQSLSAHLFDSKPGPVLFSVYLPDLHPPQKQQSKPSPNEKARTHSPKRNSVKTTPHRFHTSPPVRPPTTAPNLSNFSRDNRTYVRELFQKLHTLNRRSRAVRQQVPSMTGTNQPTSGIHCRSDPTVLITKIHIVYDTAHPFHLSVSIMSKWTNTTVVIIIVAIRRA